MQTIDNSEKNGWIKIKLNNNNYYVYSKYVSKEETVASKDSFAGYFTLTYYCACKKCCGKTDGITAWGTKATPNKTIATSSKYAFGTKMIINDHTYVVEDRGGAIQGNKIDVYVESHYEALQLGVKKNVPVYIGK